LIDIERTEEVKLDLGRSPESRQVGSGLASLGYAKTKTTRGGGRRGKREWSAIERKKEAKEAERKRERERERETEPRVSSRGLPCERLFLDLVELLEALFREKSLQSLGRGSEMPRDAGSLEQAVRGHGRCCQGGVRRRSCRKGLREPSNVDTKSRIGSQNSAHTLVASRERVFVILPPSRFPLTHGRSSIAIAVDASERARARSFPSTPRSAEYRVADARDECRGRNTHFRMRIGRSADRPS